MTRALGARKERISRSLTYDGSVGMDQNDRRLHPDWIAFTEPFWSGRVGMKPRRFVLMALIGDGRGEVAYCLNTSGFPPRTSHPGGAGDAGNVANTHANCWPAAFAFRCAQIGPGGIGGPPPYSASHLLPVWWRLNQQQAAHSSLAILTGCLSKGIGEVQMVATAIGHFSLLLQSAAS